MYKEHFDAFIAAWNDGNLDGLDEYVSANIVRKAPNTINSSANNLTELKKVVTDFRTAFPDIKVTIDELHFSDNHSFAKWTFTGTNTGPGEYPPTGKSVNISGSSIARYEDGKLVEDCVYMDVLEFMLQLGQIELPKSATA